MCSKEISSNQLRKQRETTIHVRRLHFNKLFKGAHYKNSSMWKFKKRKLKHQSLSENFPKWTSLDNFAFTDAKVITQMNVLN